MKTETKQMLQKLVQRFNLSVQTHHHAILLIYMLNIKAPKLFQKQFIKIKKKTAWSNCQDSEEEQLQKQLKNFVSQEQFQLVEKSQIPSAQKTLAIISTFLSHKIYEPYPLCINYMLRFLQIDQKFQEYMINLQMEAIKKFKWKIQNLIPFNETLYVCQKWDTFTQKLSEKVVDVRFQINRLFKQQKIYAKTCHQIKQQKIRVQNGQCDYQIKRYEQNYNFLRENLQKLVYNNLLYEYIVKNQNIKSEISPIRKIALSLVYKIVAQLSNLSLNKYKIKLKLRSFTQKSKNNLQYEELLKQSSFNYIFNDFLKNQFEMDLRDLKNQLSLVNQILNKKRQRFNTKLNSINDNQNINSRQKNYLNEDKMRMVQNRKNYKLHHLYHQKIKRNRSISSTKTEQENSSQKSLKQANQNKRCFSILTKQKQRNKQVQSTMGRSIQSDIDSNSLKHDNYDWSLQKSKQKLVHKKQKSVASDKRNKINIIAAFQIL